MTRGQGGRGKVGGGTDGRGGAVGAKGRFKFLSARMVHSGDGAWYCPRHGLLVTAKALLGLYQVEGDADWSEICAVIREVLPEVIHKVEAGEIGAARLDPAPRRR